MESASGTEWTKASGAGKPSTTIFAGATAAIPPTSHRMTSHGRETEIKLAVPNAAAAARLLRSAGFRVAKRRVFETNTAWDTPAQTLRKASQLLRIRRAGHK